ncbi:hypothetical protein DIPPA_24471 [Diplonema papillatum]|nr:hypothetical protein DIPPA_24471 [Diplonema papillatum]
MHAPRAVFAVCALAAAAQAGAVDAVVTRVNGTGVGAVVAVADFGGGHPPVVLSAVGDELRALVVTPEEVTVVGAAALHGAVAQASISTAGNESLLCASMDDGSLHAYSVSAAGHLLKLASGFGGDFAPGGRRVTSLLADSATVACYVLAVEGVWAYSIAGNDFWLRRGTAAGEAAGGAGWYANGAIVAGAGEAKKRVLACTAEMPRAGRAELVVLVADVTGDAAGVPAAPAAFKFFEGSAAAAAAAADGAEPGELTTTRLLPGGRGSLFYLAPEAAALPALLRGAAAPSSGATASPALVVVLLAPFSLVFFSLAVSPFSPSWSKSLNTRAFTGACASPTDLIPVRTDADVVEVVAVCSSLDASPPTSSLTLHTFVGLSAANATLLDLPAGSTDVYLTTPILVTGEDNTLCIVHSPAERNDEGSTFLVDLLIALSAVVCVAAAALFVRYTTDIPSCVVDMPVPECVAGAEQEDPPLDSPRIVLSQHLTEGECVEMRELAPGEHTLDEDSASLLLAE